jgi:predicted Zn-dependent peptidase
MDVKPDETVITISGLEENLERSIALEMDILRHPAASPEDLEKLIKKTLAQREDDRKDQGAISRALTEYARYGAKSSYLTMLPGEDIRKLTVEELLGAVRNLLNYRHSITYTGTVPLEKVMAFLEKAAPASGPLREPPAYEPRMVRQVEKNTIYFLDKDFTQCRARIEFGSEVYNEANYVPGRLLASYLGEIAYQELREARGLAYDAWAWYAPGQRKGDQNYMTGGIGCQPDKVNEAMETFYGVFDALPASQERFSKSAESMLNSYRAGKLGFREVIPAVLGWERLGLTGDPRAARYEELQKADMNGMFDYYRKYIQKRPKIISIVGNKERAGAAKLAKSAEITAVDLDTIFVK